MNQISPSNYASLQFIFYVSRKNLLIYTLKTCDISHHAVTSLASHHVCHFFIQVFSHLIIILLWYTLDKLFTCQKRGSKFNVFEIVRTAISTENKTSTVASTSAPPTIASITQFNKEIIVSEICVERKCNAMQGRRKCSFTRLIKWS